MQPEKFPDQPFDSISDHGGSYLAACGYADPCPLTAYLRPDYDKMGCVQFPAGVGKSEKFSPFTESLVLYETEQTCSLLGSDSHGKTLAPFGATALDDKPAIFCGHSDEKTMGSFPRGIARLKRSFHCLYS